MDNRYLRYTKVFSSYLGASLITMLLNLAINPLIARNMSPEDYAISGYYSSYSSLIVPVIAFYMIHYYIKEYFRIEKDERIRLFSAIAKALIWFSGLISGLCFLILIIYLKFLDSSLSLPISPYLAFTVFSLPLTGLYNLQLAEYRMKKESKSYFCLAVGNGVILVMLNLIFIVFFKWGAFGKLLAPLIGNLLVFCYLIWKFRSFFRISTRKTEYLQIIRFCWPLALSAMLGYFTSGFTTTYLESIGDNYRYGLYVVGASIGSYLTVFSTAIGNTFQPDLYESIIKKQWRKWIKICLAEIGLTIIIAMSFIILAPYVIDILTGGRYIDSTPYARIIAISTITSLIYFLINAFTIATNHPKFYLYTSVIGSLSIVLLMPYFVHNYSFIGGCWLSVISFLIFAFINILLLILSHLRYRLNSI